MNKKQRSANFDEEDRNRLLDLIETSGKKEVLESKLKKTVQHYERSGKCGKKSLLVSTQRIKGGRMRNSYRNTGAISERRPRQTIRPNGVPSLEQVEDHPMHQ